CSPSRYPPGPRSRLAPSRSRYPPGPRSSRSRYPPGPPGLPGPPRLSLGTGEEGIFGRGGGFSGSLTFMSEIESNQWLPLEADFGLGGGGTTRVGVVVPAALSGVAGPVLAAIF